MSIETTETYLVTGAQGMLGAAVMKRLEALGLKATGADLSDADLTRLEAGRRLFDRVRPTQVIHCAAYTNVDGAESNVATCEAANVRAPENVAHLCQEFDASMQLISTDFVFGGGQQGRPCKPDDPVGPLGVYARTKYEGEQAVAAVFDHWQIIRTAWLFGPGKHNFVLAILKRLRTGEPLRVVSDQIGSPTYTLHLAERLIALGQSGKPGIYHCANAGQCSWYAFARHIASGSGYDPDSIAAIQTADWPSPAPRPSWSVLDCSKTFEQPGVTPMPEWTEALAHYLAHPAL